jgi:hypothetical protein
MTNKDNTVNYGGGIGFFGILTLIFITLKLTGVINWSWWLILLPFYGPVLLFVTIVVIVFVVVFCAAAIMEIVKNLSK